MRIGELTEFHPELLELARLAKKEGHRHMERLANDYLNGANRFAEPGEMLLAAWEGTSIIGIGGLNRDPYAECGRIGRVRRVYVRPEYRRNGVAKQLMSALIAAAHKNYDKLTLYTEHEPAASLYRSLGFKESPEGGRNSHSLELAGS
ncbi:GNAT family N-acetyltransferase [Paenibacillus sp. D51F]